MTDTIYTPEQIVEYVKAHLKPLPALELSDGNRLARVRTHVYDQVRIDGKTIHLKRKDGKYTAIYIRVSTFLQQEDGFSDVEQALMLILKCVDEGEAFAVFCDTGLSGGLPWDNSDLIQKIVDHKADMFDTVFRAVFMSRLDQETPENAERLEQYVTNHVKQLRAGNPSDIADVMDGDSPQRTKVSKRIDYRPGLTALVQALRNIHTLRVTDLSRLSRSAILTRDLAPRLWQHKVDLIGLYQDLSVFNDRRDGMMIDILKAVYTHQADQGRFDVLMGSLRGIRQKLLSGKYHGKPPSWIIRDDSKARAQLRPDVSDMIRDAVELYLSDEGDRGKTDDVVTMRRVTTWLRVESKRRGVPISWVDDKIADFLSNPALIGYQQIFGKWWLVYPPLISEEEWKDIQAKRKRLREDHDRQQQGARTNEWMLSGLLKCWCGYNLTSSRSNNDTLYYACVDNKDHRDRSRPHARLQKEVVEAFFDDLMRQHHETVFEIIADHSDGAALMEELRQLEEGSLAKEHTWSVQEAEYRHTVTKQIVGTLQVPEEDASFPIILEGLVDKWMRPIMAEKDQNQKRITDVRARLSEVQVEEEFQKNRSVVRGWPQLTTAQKNRVLKSTFAYFRHQGEPPNEGLMPYLRTPTQPDYMLPIDINARRWGRSFIRALEPSGAWVRRMSRQE